MIGAAMEAGYRHFDCAEMYENEEKIGIALEKALKACGVQRDQIWITSKVPPYRMDYENAKECIKESIANLRCGYLDLALIHWPTSIIGEPGLANRLETWKAFEEMKKEELVKSIGVSNFTEKHLQEFADNKIIPSVNQIEIHPLYIDSKAASFCKKHRITLIGYAPLATYDERLMKAP
jgi:diketogulonate reductase-like aldo/keto reductase